VTLVLAVLVASLLGSVHCAAMCGAFVCFYANGSPAASRRSEGAGHLAYNLGRLVSYLALGTLAGAAGGMLDRAGGLAGMGNVAAVVAGMLMIGWGASAMLAARGVRIGGPGVPAGWQHAMGRALHLVRSRPPLVRAAVTGLVTTLLPCGWLYAFVVTAGGTGTAARGALVMLVFWVGTLPMMVTVGVGARALFGPLRSRLPMISAATIMILGLLSIANHFGWVPGMQWLHQLMPDVPVAGASAAAPAHAHHIPGVP
jgi:sulfite exporter TauE/SafE